MKIGSSTGVVPDWGSSPDPAVTQTRTGETLALIASRFAVPDRAKAAAREAAALRDKAVQARAAGQLADAAEYARQGAARAEGPLKSELLCLRADSLSRAGGGGEAEQARAEASAAGAPCPASP